MIPIGARLAEMARIRLRYDEARRHVQTIQQVTTNIDMVLISNYTHIKDSIVKLQISLNKIIINYA